MKKILFVAMMFFGVSVQAAEVGLTVGRDKVYNRDYTAFSVGTSAVGLKLNGSLQTVRDRYVAFGSTVGKSFGFGAFTVAPSAGLWMVNPAVGKNGYVATVGVEGSYALTKQAALVVDFTRRFNLNDATAFRGNQIGAGLKVSF